MLVTRAVLTRWLRASMILYHKLAASLQTARSVAVEAEFVNDQERELGIEADAVVDGLVRQCGGEVFQEFAAGDVADALFEHARSQADALDQPAFSQAGLADEDDVLLAANEVALGQSFDLQAWNRRIEVPVEGAQGKRFAEVGVLDEAFDAALAAQAGLIGEQAMQELQVRPAGVLGFFKSLVELVGASPGYARSRSRRGSGHAGCGRVRLVLLVFLGTGLHRWLPRVQSRC